MTTEIKPHIRGKYFLQIDDNYRQQSVEKNFVTLEDAVKTFYATVKARTIDNYGNEKVKHRDAVKAIAEIENRTVEEVRNDIGRCTDNFGIYKNSSVKIEEIENAAAEVEEVNAEKNSLAEKVAEIKKRPRKSAIDWAGTKVFEKVFLAENIFAMLKTLCKNYRVA